ncbi:MAG: hypothetical protein PHT77_10335 [Bacteroidales bacterium]|nr:hypothetical protein [Bacteroidales bacterium]
MFGIPKIPKIVLIVGIAAVIVIAALYMIPAEDWEDGAPTATISVQLTETDTLESYAGDIEIEPQSIIGRAMSIQPLTTYTSDVPPLDALGTYSIAFTITVTTVGNIEESYTTTIDIVGYNNKTEYKVSGDTGPREYSTSIWGSDRISTLSQATQYSVPTAFVMPSYLGSFKTTNTDDSGQIIGEHIDGSVFLVTIYSQSASGSYGLTSASIGLTVGAGGSLYIQINGIETTVA